MSKKSKNQESNGATDSSATEDAAQPTKRSKASSKTTKGAAKKSTAKTGGKKTSAGKPARKRGGYEPSDDEIRLRAYFIAERRVQLSLGGDPANDWLEARKQLLEEADQRKIAAPVSE